MPVSTHELNDFLSNPGHARFVHTNLHLHTPATPWDWDCYPGQTQKAATLTPEAYFDALSKTSLELVAITDHNCIIWCKHLIDLAHRARKEGRSNLHILPGVEITTYEGPHLLAIFDEAQDVTEIKKMLVRLGMSGEGRQEDRVGCLSPNDEITIPKVLGEVVDNLGGIVIAPHVHQKNGLWGPKEFRGRIEILNDHRLRILAAPSGDIKRVSEQPNRVRLLYKNMDTTQITNSFGFINVSDCHRLDDFEVNTTWIKMTTPSLNGIRQVIYEPEIRLAHNVIKTTEQVEYPESVHFAEPVETTHPHVIAVSITGGMLDRQRLTFSPHQNSIIGKNYAGKSALLDCLRFALNAVPFDPDPQSKFADRMRAFIGEGGEVRVYLRDEHEKVYGVSRTLSCTRVGRGANIMWQIEGMPDVSLLWNGEFRRESDLSVEKIFHLEVYPQGEVVKIKDNASRQMRIVDALAKLESDLQDLTISETNGEKTLRGKLADNSQKIISMAERHAELAEEVSNIAQLQEEIEGLEKLTTSPLFSHKRQWSETEVRIDSYRRELVRLSESWSSNNLLPTLDVSDLLPSEKEDHIEESEPFNEDVASPDEYSQRASQIVEATVETVKQGVTTNKNSLRSAIESLVNLEAARKAREDKVETEIRSNLKPEDQGTVEGGLIDRITEKRRRLNDLLQKRRELEGLQTELERLSEERKYLLGQFSTKRERIREARRAIVQMIDTESASNIKAELVENADREQYRRLLDEVADRLTSATNKIQSKEAQLSAIAANVSPSQLAQIARGGDANKLIQLAPEVTPNTAKIILSMGQADLHKIEECALDDKFVISYQKYGEPGFTPIDSGLSGGEQALALISVAMVPKQLPLVIDQPEDELGPALITHELVEQIRHVKSTRQLIFVTHVPNIPVLADSEQVIYVEQEFTEGGKFSIVKCNGSLDQRDVVVHLLELDGGDIAFRKRSERYSAVIQSSK